MNHQRNIIASSAVMVVALVVIGWIIGGPTVGKIAITDINIVAESLSAVMPFDAGFRLLPEIIPEASTTVAAFAAIKTNVLNKADNDFLNKYISHYSPDNQPPVSKSKTLVTKAAKIIATFETNYNKPYQCLVDYGAVCPTQNLILVANLETLKAVLSFEQNKIDYATSTAMKIIDFGRNLANHQDGSGLEMTIGWAAEKNGYIVLLEAAGKGFLNQDTKTKLIAELRTENKNFFRYAYTREAEFIDYIVSPANKPHFQINSDTENLVSEIRESASSTNWNPEMTKKYFFNSYKKEVTNVDLTCGASTTPTGFDFKADLNNPKTENYIGKNLYMTTFTSWKSLNDKRCEIESLIGKL